MPEPISIIDSFDRLLDMDPRSAADDLTSLLAEAANSDQALADARAVQILESRTTGDAIVAHLDLDALRALAERTIARQGDGAPLPDDERRWQAWSLLDIVRRSPLLVRIAEAGAVDEWADMMLRLVDSSHFTFGPLFEQRVAGYGSQTLFEVPGTGPASTLSWHQTAGRVGLIARGLLAVLGDDPEPVAILSENRLEMALTDLACLTTGIVNVMIPAIATDTEVAYILEHSRAGTVVVSSPVQLKKVAACRDRLGGLQRVIAFDAAAAVDRDVLGFDEVLGRASEVPVEVIGERRGSVDISDLATVMYTSGTTGRPKGIRFSQRNIVFKRFARALALPEIGDRDRLLCYLPLFHTFGRFLEMTGAVFWGATYRFADSPSVDALTRNMAEFRPSVFISIPMKWTQLYERIGKEVDLESAPDDEIAAAVARVTGGELRWGLSAAGYLDPEIFRFFQRYGVELMSGFGMTEATGGITMTPPGAYADDSLGVPLPGIEAELADDGELVIRGPYVMIGYLDDPEGRPSFDDDGWFHSGDLMERAAEGHFRMVDRKKEIYKNVKGQTIAPQKIENLFRDFASVARIFLIGDHRPYNTALIYPNFDFEEVDFRSLDATELKAHFRSLVVSANSFLAPYERIVDFAVIDRDLSADRGELTPKGTYRRKTVERGFAEIIRLLYRRTTLTVGGAAVTVPNWLFQAMGITSQELAVDGDRLSLGSVGRPTVIRTLDDGEIVIDSVIYGLTKSGALDLGVVLSTPPLWLGNQGLVELAPLASEHRNRRRHRSAGLQWRRLHEPHVPTAGERNTMSEALQRPELDLMDLHVAALGIGSGDVEAAGRALELLDRVIKVADGELAELALVVLRRAAAAASDTIARQAFRVLAQVEHPTLFRPTLRSFLDAVPDLLDETTGSVLNDHELSPEIVAAFIDEAEDRIARSALDPTAAATAASMLDFLSDYGASHPSRYRQLRGFITRMAVAETDSDNRSARRALDHLQDGFRHWLGPASRIAIDPETGLEYRWDDVVAFSDDVDEEARRRILAAVKSTTLVREGVFLFSHGVSVRLDDILPGGVWVRELGAGHGKSVYRVAVKSRNKGHFDLAINVNHELDDRAVREEIDWLVICSEPRELGPLVEDFGGYWPEHGMWTEEFIPGETLDHAMTRLSRRDSDRARLEALWPFAAWSAMSAYVDFWNRTGRRLVVDSPAPGNVIVPTHDYHAGARLVSIAARREFSSLPGLFADFKTNLIDPIEASIPCLGGRVGWDVVFSSLLEIVGETEGRRLLDAVLDQDGPGFAGELERYLVVIADRGFLPRRLFFAAKRFRIWDRLALDATPTVRARTLQELYETYRLSDLRDSYPESRARFFRETVLRNAPGALAEGLEAIIAQLRSGTLVTDDLSSAVADLRARLDLSQEHDFFLARLSYPHLRPEDEASYVAAVSSGVRHSEMVVSYDDADGRVYYIRHALNPKEIARLHRLFLAAKLPVQFRPEHRFLVAVSDRGHLLGGLFYEVQPEAHTAHMDKVVVAETARGQGVAGHLIEELANRLRAESYRWLTTGFFRPQFFYRYGFTVERRYAGLVRSLRPDPEEAS